MTTTLRKQVIAPKYYLLDAAGMILGRIATRAAYLLQGKAEPDFTPATGGKDVVIVINAGGTKVTGQKLQQKTYYRHSGYPGGLHKEILSEKIVREPLSVLREAVYGMLPKNRTRSRAIRRLKLFPDSKHPYSDKKPQVITLN